MTIIYGILIGILIIGIVIFTRPLTTTIHELGHAIPALLFTRKEVIVYVGSYGNIENSLKFKIGRLTYIFRFNLLDWNLGMCVPEGETTHKESIWITLGGPLASLLFGLSLFYFISQPITPMAQFIIGLLIVSTILDFIVNILPSNKPLRLHDGSSTYNDGMHFVQLMRARNYPDEYFKVIDLLEENKWEEAIQLLQKLKEDGFHAKELYLIMTNIYMNHQNFEEASSVIFEMKEHHELEPTDLELMARCYYEMGKKTEAIQLLSNAINQDFWSVYAFNFRGYIFNEIGYHEKALEDFNKAIYLDSKFLEAYNNRATCYLEMNQLQDAITDIQYVLSIDENNALAYKNLGVYHLKSGNKSEAILQLNQALSLDDQLPELKELLIEAEREN